MMREYSKPIFVFGSNRAGRHGKGAAFVAWMHYGAQRGVGEGHTGDAYAIPTKCENVKTLPLTSIKRSVDVFLDYAETHPELTFRVVRIGCGLAGYHDDDIGPMFSQVTPNCIMPLKWKPYIQDDKVKYWNS